MTTTLKDEFINAVNSANDLTDHRRTDDPEVSALWTAVDAAMQMFSTADLISYSEYKHAFHGEEPDGSDALEHSGGAQ